MRGRDDGVAAPRSADDDLFGVGERDDGGEDSADGLAEGVAGGRRLGARAGRGASSRSTSMAVTPACLRPSWPNTSMKENAGPSGRP